MERSRRGRTLSAGRYGRPSGDDNRLGALERIAGACRRVEPRPEQTGQRRCIRDARLDGQSARHVVAHGAAARGQPWLIEEGSYGAGRAPNLGSGSVWLCRAGVEKDCLRVRRHSSRTSDRGCGIVCKQKPTREDLARGTTLGSPSDGRFRAERRRFIRPRKDVENNFPPNDEVLRRLKPLSGGP